MITIETALFGPLTISSSQLIDQSRQNNQTENEIQRYSTYFGLIHSVRQADSGSSVYICNERGHEVMMSHNLPHVDVVAQRCINAMGNENEVNIVTSTYTKNSMSAQYFCDIEEI